MENCIFCRIVSGREQKFTVYEDRHLLAFLDIEPVNKGHTLIIPKKHYPTILDVNPDEMTNLVRVIQLVAKGLKENYGYEAFNIHQNNGSTAGQMVHHLHFHIWPRTADDRMEIVFPNSGISYDQGEMESIARRIGMFYTKKSPVSFFSKLWKKKVVS